MIEMKLEFNQHFNDTNYIDFGHCAMYREERISKFNFYEITKSKQKSKKKFKLR